MSFSIRKGEKKDMAAAFELITELAVFENEPDAVKITVDNLLEDGFKESPEFSTFFAEIEGKIVGMALYYKRYSTWEGKSIHLEDLIVREKYREQGIGKALYLKVMEFAYKNNINRVEWEVLDWNKRALDFYLSTGATLLENWNLCQMTKANMITFLEKNESI